MVARIFDAQPVARDFRRVWERSLAPGRYLFHASALGAAPSPGIASTFPHRLDGAGSGPDAAFYQQ